MLTVARAAVLLLAHLWLLQLPCAALEAPQYVYLERGKSGVCVTWPLGNDAEQRQRWFLDDGRGENERSLREAFHSRKVEGAHGTEGVSEPFPLQLCLGDSS